MPPKVCKNQANHQNHMCSMKINQQFDEVKKLRIDATHFCINCESPTSDPARVCNPKKYEGTVGILKWKE